MAQYKHISKIIAVVMAVAVTLCFLAIAYSGKLTELLGGTGVRMEYESKLFDTDEPISIDIQMDEDTWNEMLSNAISEEYYVCDVTVNGKKVSNVAIRPKGNTSLSSIAMDPDSDRYSLKLEFDHFVEGQTCYGLDKLILNNNYADATNMKEAIIYDMYQYIGAEASLYNYAKVSVNGEYWGVYLALEGVEQSFMLRNFGSKDGELYKPDSMEMGGGDNSSSGGSAPAGGSFGPGGGASGFDPSEFKGKTPPSGAGGFSGASGFGGRTPASDTEGSEDSGDGSDGLKFDSESMPEGFGSGEMPEGFDPNNMPEGFNFDPDNMPEGFGPGEMPEGFNFDPNNMPEGFDPDNMPGGFNSGSGGAFGGSEANSGAVSDGSGVNDGKTSGDSGANSGTVTDGSDANSGTVSDGSDANSGTASGGSDVNSENSEESSSGSGKRPGSGKSGPSGMGGFSRGNGGANLNYSDDDLDSYTIIWDGEITGTGKADHRRVVTALKNISEGTDLEKYLDVDNVLKYMAVHTFAVNMDSLSGNMSHNYYLYEYDGQLNIFPWDYNLSFGGMSMGGGSDATSMVNDAIDTPFSGTQFFDALLSNEEYLERYHTYLRQLVDEYVNGGRFDETYNRIRNQIDSLVETDPTAFYSYEEYQTAAPILYETVKLRAESIEGQLDGTIPSTDEGQREDSSNLIDASHIDVNAMGQFNMGGSSQRESGGGRDRKSGDGSSGEEAESSSSGGESGGNSANSVSGSGSESGQSEENPSGNDTEGTSAVGSGSGSESAQPADNPSGNDTAGNSAAGSGSEQSTERKENGPGSGFGGGQMPGGFTPGGSGGSNQTGMKNLVSYGICLAIMAAALIFVKLYRRRKP